jgi:hypothetical protein
MSNATLAHAPAPTDEQIDRILDATADSFVRQLRSPIGRARKPRGHSLRFSSQSKAVSDEVCPRAS